MALLQIVNNFSYLRRKSPLHCYKEFKNYSVDRRMFLDFGTLVKDKYVFTFDFRTFSTNVHTR